jgi:hypothetical protein
MKLRVVLVVAATAIAISGCGDVDRDPYVQRNEEIRKALPKYPGARPISVEHSPARSGPDGKGPVVSYGTTVIYRVPPRTRPQDVADFYSRRLNGWRLVQGPPNLSRRALQGVTPPPVLRFARGNASVAVNLDNIWEQVRTYVVGVDHAYYESLTAWLCLQ